MSLLLRFKLVCILVFYCLLCNSQNVNDLGLRDSCAVEEVHESRIYYSKNDTSFSKKSYLIGASGLVYQEISYRENKTKQITFLYKKGTNLLRKEYRSVSSKSDIKKKSGIINRYIYDGNNRRIAIISTTEHDSLRFIKEFEYNDRGHQISAEYFDIPLSTYLSMPGYVKDTTIYDYKNNTRTWKKIAANGEMIVGETGGSIYRDNISRVDSFGNVLSTNTGFEYRYQYDEMGNWTKKESYRLEKSSKLILDYVRTRKIKYRS